MSEKNLIQQLTEAFRCLPGVGPKTAQRMVLHLLERDRDGGARLARALESALSRVGHCGECRNLTEAPVCDICSNPARDQSLICVVESPADVYAIEGAGAYRGRYFVLMGHLSPIDGIGPDDLGLDILQRLAQAEQTVELILATNPTVEGEATAHYITDLLKPAGIKVSRLAHGIPIGGELEYVDASTLSHALEGRKLI